MALRIKLAACALLLLLPPAARAGIDAPGNMEFSFWAHQSLACENWDQVPEEELDVTQTATYFSSDASEFGDDGAFIWASFELQGPHGPRHGMLLMDLNLKRAPLDDREPMPRDAIRAEYIERTGDKLLFAGEVASGDVWIVDVIYHGDDKGALEGDFAFIFNDPTGRIAGCRAMMRGSFISDPSPAGLRLQWELPPESTREEEHVHVDCSGQVYYADDGSGCGGDDSGSSGCEGDGASSSGCEGDTGGGSGCEGDAGGGSGCSGDAGGGSCGGGGGGCSGGGGGACAGAATAATMRPRNRGRPLQILLRFLPELSALGFIFWMRRKSR